VPKEIELYKKGFLEDSLRHSVYSIEDIHDHNYCPPIVVEMYCMLLDMARGKLEAGNKQLIEKLNSWKESLENMESLFSLADRNEKIGDSTSVMSDDQVRRLKQVLAERERQLAVLYASTSWRVTWPLRLVGHQAKKTRYALSLIKSEIDARGGLKKSIREAVEVYRYEGIPGLKRALVKATCTVSDRSREKGH